MLKSNSDEIFSKQEKFLINLKDQKKVDALMTEISVTTLSSNKRRVHNNGLNPSGGKLGNYGGGALYVNPKNSPKGFGANTGKTGRSRFSNGSPHKTKYFKSYKGFRSEIGRKTDSVNLELFGDLRRGFVFEKRGVKYVLGIVKKQVKKYEGLEIKYGQIYGVSDKDRKFISKAIKRFISSSR